jgi:Helix-turn-helix
MVHPPCLDGSLVLVVQRSWLVASALTRAFEARGAKVLMAREPTVALADLPQLDAAVLDDQSHGLCLLLEARGIAFVSYSARAPREDARAPIVGKPAPAEDVVARVEQLLVRRHIVVSGPTDTQDGKQLSAARELAGLTILELAAAASIAPRTLNRLENGGVIHVSEKKRRGHVQRAVWQRIIAVLAAAGVELLPEGVSFGAGVRWVHPRPKRSVP